jgi:superfamily II DNA or RNA helicase
MQDNFDDLEVKRGDYTEQSQYAHFNKARLYSGVVDKWKEYGNNQKTIVFNVNIEHAEKQTAEFNRAGVESYCITSKTKTKEREKILADFTAGAFQVLNNCGILTTGYDEPSIKVVIVNRKTKSLPLWLQCVGRGSRTYPGKESFLLLDFGQNHNEHGLWSTERTWTIEQPKKKKKEQAAPVKDCPGCGAMLYANTRLCPYCNMTMELKAIYNEKTGVMVEVLPSSIKGRKLSSLSINELIKVQKLGEVKAAMVWRVVRSHGVGAVKQYAKAAGYSNGWVYRQQKEINNCTFYDKII